MKVGILEILALPSQNWVNTIFNQLATKQFVSITPQVISVWCRQQGHETFYATYYGIGNAYHLLPPDLDIIFISCYTQTSPIAYALAKLYRKTGTRTVIGGPHAKSFPVDCLRFFDLVVKECDKALIIDILAGHFEPGSFISSAKPYDDVPTVEERMPEIRTSVFAWKKWSYFSSIIPMLASTGCPYQCDFCMDWNSPYRLLSTDRLAEYLRYLAKNLPGTLIEFTDPNFGIKFEPVFDTLESLPPDSRVPYMMECSLGLLRESRIKRLKETNCVVSVHGIESWMDYSNKTGLGRKDGLEKVYRVVEHLQLIFECVPYIQAGFIFGLDTDMGEEPFTLTKHFLEQAPFVWPTFNMLIPFGGTPLYQKYLADDRILEAIPFCFYYTPYLVTTLKNYDPVSYFEHVIDLSSFLYSDPMHKRRMKCAKDWKSKYVHWLRTIGEKIWNSNYRRILDRLRSDAQFRAFHEGQSKVLPAFYRYEYERMLGSYTELFSPSELTPNLEQMEPKL